MEIDRTTSKVIFTCSHCQTKGRIGSSISVKNNIKLRCPRCKHVFNINNSLNTEELQCDRKSSLSQNQHRQTPVNIQNKLQDLKNWSSLILMIILFFAFAAFLGKGNILTFTQIIADRTIITIGIAIIVSLCILFISSIIAYIQINIKTSFTLLSLLLSICPVVMMIDIFQDQLDDFFLQLFSLIFSGFLIYYFSDQLSLELEKESQKTYIESYIFKNKPLIFILREKIFLENIRHFPVCCIQVATYTLFTDILIFEEKNGIGIMSWLYTVEDQGLFSEYMFSIYVMIIISFMFFIQLYNFFILKKIEYRLSGR